MLAGPIFSREALTLPRQMRHFLIRSGYVAALFVLIYTAGQSTFGWQQIRNLGDLSRFGSLVFQLFSMIQLSLVLFFSLLFAANNVAQEKDRQTLILLLMTDLKNRELVLGKLLASFLTVAVLLVATIPGFLMVRLLGGVGLDQIFWSLAICGSAALAAGSWGTLVACWKEKTFQTLAISVLGLVLLIGIAEAGAGLAGADSPVGSWLGRLNPYRALFAVLNPWQFSTGPGVVVVRPWESVVLMLGLAFVLNGISILRLRVWNPPRTVYETSRTAAQQEAAEQTRGKSRQVWSNPVIWREIRTRAYGRRVFVIKLAYLVLAGFAVLQLAGTGPADEQVLGMISPAGFLFVGLSILSLVLINAQAVTSLTSERDGRTLELLLMTDVTAKEFVFGKLGGVLYNTLELLLVPLGLAVWYLVDGRITGEILTYMIAGFLVLAVFSAMLGLHSGLSWESSRQAIASSLGTMFFLFIGIIIFMMLLVEARSSFFLQFQSFVVFIGIGGIALYAVLSHRNPSPALMIAGGLLPFLTFYAITEFLLAGTLGVCLSIAVAYGFTTLAMLVPAISEFDVALGRATLDRH